MPDEVTMSGGDADFDKMFDDLASKASGGTLAIDADPPAAPAAGDPPAAPAAGDPPAAAAAPAAGDPPAAAAAGDPPAAPAEGDPPAAAAAPAAEPTTREVLQAFMEQMAASRQPAPPPAAPRAPPAPAPIYNEAELATLTQFAKDWPDLATAMQLMLRGGLTVNNQQIYDQMSRVMGPALSNVQAVADSQQLNTLQRLIPDYEKVRDPVIQWVHEAPMPDYLRRAYVSVIEDGEANEVADLVGRWREATGAKPAPAAPAKPANELSEAVRQAAQTLAPVISQRTAHIEAEPQGFDDAFEAAAKMFAQA